MSLEIKADLVDRVRDIALRAGQEILVVYNTDFNVEAKGDASPVTEADRRAETLIMDAIRREVSEAWPIVAEEDVAAGNMPKVDGTPFWLVDPLDGTKEFIQRNGEFTVNIALVHAHRPVLGVVHAPVLQRDYYAVEGYGALRVDGDGTTKPIRVRQPPARPLRIVGSRSHRGDSLDGFLARAGEHELVAIGSSLKLCLVAEGAADVYPRLGPTMEWDTAAGQAVVEQAGGHVVGLDGQPLAYNARPELLNPHFLAYGDERGDWLQKI